MTVILRRLMALVSASVLFFAPHASGQDLSDLKPGDWVRYDTLASVSADDPLLGEVSTIESELLRIRAGGELLEIRIESLHRLQVQRGTENYRWPGGIVGAGGGCGVGLLLDDDDSLPDVFSCGAGLVAGGVAGYFVGRLVKEPRWVDVELAPANGGVQVGLSVRLRR